MGNDDAARARVVTAARELFAELGYGATTLDLIANRAGLSGRAVRRLLGGKREILDRVLAGGTGSPVAGMVEDAASHPDRTPPLSVLIEAAHRMITDPQASWDTLELELLARARKDPDLLPAARARVAHRFENARALTAASRRSHGIDPELADAAVVQLSMALSIGLAMLDAVTEDGPTPQQWDALIARIGAAVAPSDLLLQSEFAVTTRWRLRVDVPDRPGGISRLLRALGTLHMYAVYLQVVGYVRDPVTGEVMRTIDLGLLAPEQVTEDVIRAAAESAGHRAYLRLGSEDDTGEDLLARTLDGATFLVKHPEDGPRLAAALVAADGVEVIDAAEGVDDSADVLRLQWTADRHVLLHRTWAPFASTEQARASAVLRLASAVARLSGQDDASGWIEPVAGGTVWIRLARPEDDQAVAQMHERTSERSRYQRYFSLTEWRDVRLRRLTGGHRGASLVAMSRDGHIVGLGNVFPTGDGHTAEIAILVEDAQQGSGVGSALLRRMLQVAPRMGFTDVVAHVLAENTGMIRLLERTGLTWETHVSEGVSEMMAVLPEGA